MPVPVMLMVVAVAMVIKSLAWIAPVKAAEAPLVMVKSLIVNDLPVIAPLVPALRLRSKAPPMAAPKRMSWPAAESCVVAIDELVRKVTPPIPKSTTSPLLIMEPTSEAELPVKEKPAPKANVSEVSPKVTRPVLRKSTFCVKVLPVPVKDTEYGFKVVIRSLTVTAPVNAAEAPLVMVRLRILTDVPMMRPTPSPAVRPRLKSPLRRLPKMRLFEVVIVLFVLRVIVSL